MSVVEHLHSTASSVEGVRDGLGRLRSALEQTESVLDVADDVLGKADDVLESAADALETSQRWAPRIAVVIGVGAVAAIGVIVVMRWRKRRNDDE
jgi:type IV secretory pathway component VirB8